MEIFFMTCSFCHDVDHAVGCPETFSGTERDKAIREFHKGMYLGKKKMRQQRGSAAFMLGYKAYARFHERMHEYMTAKAQLSTSSSRGRRSMY